MKNRLTHNLGLKILSVIFAALLWLTVMNIADPVVTETFSNIPVQIINDEVITSRGYQYSIESGEKTSIRVKGKRSVVDNLTEADFAATADLNSMNSMYMVTITVECTSEDAGTEDLDITLRTENMAIKLEDQETQTFSVRVVQQGTPAEGYYCYESRTASTLVQVTGSHSQMQELKEIVATVDIDGRNSTFSTVSDLVAYDMSGDVIDQKKLSFSQDNVQITTGICPTKSVALEVEVVNEPADGYYIEKIEYAPNTVLIAAEAQKLEDISQIVVTCDVSGATQTIDRQIGLSELLSAEYEGCYAAETSAYVGVVITVRPYEERTLTFTESDISILNLAAGLKCDISSLWSTDITVTGPESTLQKLQASDLGMYIDLDGYGAGVYSIHVKADLPQDVTADLDAIMIRITEAEAVHSPEE